MLIVLACLSASLNCPQGLNAEERRKGREQRRRERERKKEKLNS